MDTAFDALLEADTHRDKISDALRRHAPLPPGPTLVPVARYTERRYHDLEIEKIWKKSWLMACHEDDFPNVGDCVPYDVGTLSFLVVRVAEDEYKAYYNACLHRGRKLREERATGLNELRCPFHGWSWNLGGTIKQIPCSFDFNGLVREEESLPEVQVGRWGRFIFINADSGAESLDSYLGDLSSHFELLPYDKRYKSVHVAKVIRANWKVVQEAFMESYHVLMTHPQILTGGAHDICTKYDAFGNYSRAIRCGAIEGDGLPPWEPIPEGRGNEIVRHPLSGDLYEHLGDGIVQVTTNKGKTGKFTVDAKWLEGELTDANPHLCNWVGGQQLDNPGGGRLLNREVARKTMASGKNARAAGAEIQRQMLADILPGIAADIPDIELTASIFFTVFPNWHPWGCFNQINYRFRPNGDNHEECIMECMFLSPIPENGEYTPVSGIHWLGPDDDYTQAPELGNLAKIFNQDLRNLPHVYAGMKATAKKHIRFADYNELKLRHWHEMYSNLIGDIEEST
jgi:nitrite reductase/ring-hydroxylating ferredoxin subunit